MLQTVKNLEKYKFGGVGGELLVEAGKNQEKEKVCRASSCRTSVPEG